MMKKLKNSGFTVLEMTLYMGILIVLLSVLLGVFSAALDANLESQGNSTVQQDGRYLLAKLSYDVHQASAVVSPTLGNSAPSLQLTVGGVTNTYTVSNTQLLMTNVSGSNMLSSYDASVSALTFKTLGNSGGKPSIQISFSLKSKTAPASASESANFETTIGTR